MLATIVNAVVVILGGLVGLLLGKRLKDEYISTIVVGLGICGMVIGIENAIGTEDILVVICSLVIGSLSGELLKIEEKLDCAGEILKRKVARGGNSRFTEGFVTASLLFCVGSMSVLGSFDAGVRGDYTMIFAKSALDCVMSMAFAVTMGVGVLFSSVTILLYQGALTLLAGVIEPMLSPAAIREMNAVGGIMLIATSLNVTGLTKNRIRVGNMLPALIIPAIWYAIRGLF